MKYVCLVYSEEGAFASMSETDVQTLDDDSLAYDDELADSGHLILAEALQPVEVATTLRVRNGKLSSTDGPFAETKEQLVGFVVIEATDLNEAIRIASRIPMARIGSIEVRPVMDLQQKIREGSANQESPTSEMNTVQP